jgi:galactokinase
MTGAGFGGCALALVPAEATEKVTGAVAEAFGRRGFGAPAIFAARSSDGAARLG